MIKQKLTITITKMILITRISLLHGDFGGSVRTHARSWQRGGISTGQQLLTSSGKFTVRNLDHGLLEILMSTYRCWGGCGRPGMQQTMTIWPVPPWNKASQPVSQAECVVVVSRMDSGLGLEKLVALNMSNRLKTRCLYTHEVLHVAVKW